MDILHQELCDSMAVKESHSQSNTYKIVNGDGPIVMTIDK